MKLLCFVLLLVGAAAAEAHLGTYSETRSFRDALDGRSMEEAMSGPVDKDTSSYGERAANGEAGDQMPALNIPANGNLMPAGEQGGELEREAGPLAEGQRRPVEQRAERQRAGPNHQPRQSPAMVGQRLASGRQQQQQQADEQPPRGKSSDAGFGEDNTPAAAAAAAGPMSAPKGGRSSAAPDAPSSKRADQTADRQRLAMAAMLMGMNKAPEQGYGAQRGSTGAKARSPGVGQRQMAPPVMSTLNYGMSSAPPRQQQRSSSERKMSPAMVNAMLKRMLAGYGGPAGASKPAAMAMLIKSSAGAELLTNMMAMPQVAGAVAGMPAAKREQYKRMMMAAVMQQAAAQEETSGEDEQQQQQQQGDDASYAQQASGADTADTQPAPGSKGAKSYANQQMPSSTMSPVSMLMMMNMIKASKYGSRQQQPINGGDMAQTTEAPMGSIKNTKSTKRGFSMEQQQQQVMNTNAPINGGYGSTSNNEQQQQQREMTPAAMKMMAMIKASQMRQQYSTSAPLMMMMRANGKVGSRYNQQQQQVEAQQMKEDSKDEAGIGYNMDDIQSSNEADQQQQQQVSTTESSTGSYASQEAMDAPTMASIMMNNNRPTTPASPAMNAMRNNQAYNGNNQRQQQETSTMASGTKGSPMARPTQAAYGGASLEGSPLDEQQQQDEFGPDGAAPMGMAEPFAFDYKIEDDYGNNQYRKEESDKNGVVRGSYGYMDNSGIYRHVDYVADENGFRANVKSNEPGSSGGDSKSNASPAQAMVQMMNGNGMAGAQMSPAALAQMMNQMSQMSNGMNGASYASNQQQQQKMLMPAQQELNENGEK